MVLMMRDVMNIQVEEDYDVDRWIVVDDDEDMPPLESPEEQEEIDDRRRINPAEEEDEGEEKEEDVRPENEEIPAFALPEFILRREEINVINELQDVFRRILNGYSILC